jgi:hypothetical protein
MAHSGDDHRRPVRPLIGVLRSPPQGDRCEGPREQAEAAGRCTAAPRSRRRWWRSGPNRQDARRPPEEAGEGSGGRPTKSARRCGLCRSPTGFVEAVAFQQVHRGTASAATRWRSEMAGPDSIFAKELNGDNPFLLRGSPGARRSPCPSVMSQRDRQSGSFMLWLGRHFPGKTCRGRHSLAGDARDRSRCGSAGAGRDRRSIAVAATLDEAFQA